MLIEKVVLMYATQNQKGYTAEVELETSDGLGFGGSIEFDKNWNYELGFLNTWITTVEDKNFVSEVLSSDDFKNDIINFVPED